MRAGSEASLGYGAHGGADAGGTSPALLGWLVAVVPIVNLAVPYLTMKVYVLWVFSAAVIVLFAELQGRGGRIAVRPLDLPVVLLFVWPLVTSLWSVDRPTTILQSTVVLVNLALYYLVTRLRPGDVTDVLARISLLLPIVTGVAFVLLLVAFGAVRSVETLALHGAGSFSNHAAALVVAAVPLVLFGASFYPNRWLFRVAFGASALIVIASESRAAILLFALAILMMIVLSRGAMKKRAAVLALVGSAAFLGIFVVISAGPGLGMLSSTLGRLLDSQLLSMQGGGAPSRSSGDFVRAAMYVEGLRVMQENWLIGIGYGGLYSEMERSFGFGVVSHNLFISAIGEMGLPGLAILFWAVGGAIRRLVRVRRDTATDPIVRSAATATLASLLIVLVHAQVRPFYMVPMVGLLLGAAAMLDRGAQPAAGGTQRSGEAGRHDGGREPATDR